MYVLYLHVALLLSLLHNNLHTAAAALARLKCPQAIALLDDDRRRRRDDEGEEESRWIPLFFFLFIFFCVKSAVYGGEGRREWVLCEKGIHESSSSKSHLKFYAIFVVWLLMFKAFPLSLAIEHCMLCSHGLDFFTLCWCWETEKHEKETYKNQHKYRTPNRHNTQHTKNGSKESRRREANEFGWRTFCCSHGETGWGVDRVASRRRSSESYNFFWSIMSFHMLSVTCWLAVIRPPPITNS